MDLLPTQVMSGRVRQRGFSFRINMKQSGGRRERRRPRPGERGAGGRGARSRAARTAQARRRPRAHNLTIKRTTSIVLELLVKGRRQLRSIVQTQSGGQIEPQVVRAVVLRPE